MLLLVCRLLEKKTLATFAKLSKVDTLLLDDFCEKSGALCLFEHPILYEKKFGRISLFSHVSHLSKVRNIHLYVKIYCCTLIWDFSYWVDTFLRQFKLIMCSYISRISISCKSHTIHWIDFNSGVKNFIYYSVYKNHISIFSFWI